MRDWKKFENDEIMTIWQGYIVCEFGIGDPLFQSYNHPQPIRLTPMEIVKLVEELMERLEIKDKENK